MKALFINSPGETSIGEVEKPSPAPGEVLVRVRMAGLCGSDLNTFRGKNPLVAFPLIPGHEIAATIEAAAAGVPPALAPEMDVTLSPYTACGVCPSCRRGRGNACRSNQTLGIQRDGGLTEYLVVPWEKIHAGGGLSLRQLCLVEPLSVGFHATHRGRVTAEDTVVVLGCGAIGLGAVAASEFHGATTIAVDVDDAKLALAHKAGAAHAINSQKENLHERLQALTNDDGADVVIEAIGLPATFRSAVEEAAFTGRVVYIGYAKQPVTYETKLFVQKELDIMGSRNATAEDFDGVIEMLQRGRFPVDETITTVVPLEQAGEALKAWDSTPAAFTKILIDISAPGQAK